MIIIDLSHHFNPCVISNIVMINPIWTNEHLLILALAHSKKEIINWIKGKEWQDILTRT